MHRYWLFATYDYEAGGGLQDLRGTYKSVQKAKAVVSNKYLYDSYDYYEIVDSKTWKIIWNKRGKEWKKPNKNINSSYEVGEEK